MTTCYTLQLCSFKVPEGLEMEPTAPGKSENNSKLADTAIEYETRGRAGDPREGVGPLTVKAASGELGAVGAEGQAGHTVRVPTQLLGRIPACLHVAIPPAGVCEQPSSGTLREPLWTV